MKKSILLATFAATISAYALPTYEPFTEYAAAVSATGTNSMDLCNPLGVSVTTGSVVEKWTSLNFSATGSMSGHPSWAGLDVQVTNLSTSVFTSSALSTLLPSGFPGAGSTINLCAYIPQNTLNTNNSVGNTPVLNFAQDIVRPTSGTKTIFVSFLLDITAAGQTGGGNNGRYCAFLASSNLVEGTGTSGFYTTWLSMFNSYSTSKGPTYVSYGVKSGFTGGGDWLLASDSAGGNIPATEVAGIGTPYNTAAFVVGAFVFTTGGTIKDTNILWVNPSTSAFGGPTAAALNAAPYLYTMTNIAMSDVGGFCLEDRIGAGGVGGIANMYVANLILGTTWSYVTGGPEFTAQPESTILSTPGATVSMSGAAMAAGQSVAYQWQNNGVNVTNGAGGAGGSATVSGATGPSLTLTGLSGRDAGIYTLVATASGTGFTLASSNTVLIVSDPGLLAQPQPATANYGGAGSLTATVETTKSSITYAWYNGSTMLVNGRQADGSTVIGAQGTNTGGPFAVNVTLTITNVTCADDSSYTLIVTNSVGGTVSSVPAALAVNDPYITVQPPAIAETVPGGATTITFGGGGTGATYQWYNAAGQLSNSGDDSGVTTPILTISNAQTSDAGSYYVQVTGTCGPAVTSSNTVLYLDTPPTGLTVTPPALTQQEGTHLALVGTVTGGSGVVHLLLALNGTNLNAGQQADGSFVFGPNTTLTGPGTGALILSNLQVSDSGTYTVIASNAAGSVSASSVITVVPVGQLSLATTNLIVSRVGEGSQALSGATGNTMYLDQFTTNGTYLSTVMVPDSGSNAIVVAGAAIATGNEGAQEAYLTLSSNQQFLNFGGFCYSYPYTGGSDVTAGAVSAVRGIYAINGAGIMALVYTNYGLYSGGHGFRDVYSTDGLTNFWTTGSASGGTVKYVNAGPLGAPYTITSPGQGIPALSAANSGGVCLGLVGPNLVFADNETDGDGGISGVWGLDQFVGAPEAATTATTEILPGGVGHADDFAFSPDLNTVYLADDDVSTGSGGNGGIQRWDLVSGTYQYSYNLSDNTGTGTNGTRGLVVVWPTNITTWGQYAQGAIIYATTSEVVSNRIIEIIDNAQASSTATVLATAGPNQFYRGIRFGPIQVPLSVSAGPSSQVAVVGQSVDVGAATTGNFSYYFPNAAGTGYNLISVPPATFQWYFNDVAIPGASNFLYSIPSVQASNAGSYSFVLTTGRTKVSNAVPAVVTVNPFGVNSNLVAWFQLNDGSGTNAADSSVYGDTAALYNFPADNSEWVAGLGGLHALNFANADTNSDNTVLAPDAPQLNFTNNLAFTLSAWINSLSNSQASSALISKGFGNGGEQYDLDLYTGYLRLFVRSAGGAVYSINSTSYPPSNQWRHVAAVLDGNAGVMYLYVNGQLAGTTNAPNSLLYTTNPLSIGNRTSSSTSTNDLPFLGEIQDVRLYNVALGPQDIESVYLSQNLASYASTPKIATNPPVAFVGSGQFQLTLGGAAGTTFHLWSTTNLALRPIASTWTLVTTGTFNTTGTATYVDTTATGAGKFYVVTQP
jgi:hypothetical protein